MASSDDKQVLLNALLQCDYYLYVDGKLTGGFDSVSGGEMSITTIKHPVTYESGLGTDLIIPGVTSYSAIELSGGYANYEELYTWFQQASAGDTILSRRNGTIEMRKNGNAVLRWNFFDAWPSAISGFSFEQVQGSSIQLASVTLTLQAESIELERI